MHADDIIRQLEEMLEVEAGSLTTETRLEDVTTWDSMRAMGFIALADRLFSQQPNGEQLAKCNNIGDLLDLLPLEK